jgi:hypothetical protein
MQKTQRRRRRSIRIKKMHYSIVFYLVITVDLQYRPLNSVGYSISLRYFQTLQHAAQREGELIRQVQTILLTTFIHVVPIKIYVVDVFFDMSTIIYIYIYICMYKPANVNTEYVIHIILHAACAFIDERDMKRFY